MTYGTKDISGKILAIFFLTCLFVSSGFEHSIANMYYIPAGILAKPEGRISMTLRHLRIFVEVATVKNMSRAASNLHISQPTVSQAIAELEKVYETKLFERFSKELKITESGRLLLHYAAQTLQAKSTLERAMREHNAMDLIRIGGTVTVGTCVLTDIVQNIVDHHADINVYLYVNNTRIIERKLLSNDLDIALVEGTIQSKEIVIRPIIPDTLVFVCNSTHPLAGRKELSLEEACCFPFILREKGSGTRARFEEAIRTSKLTLNVRGEYNNSEAIINAVSAGLGVTVISLRLIRKALDTGQLKVLPLKACEPMERFFSLAWHRDKYISPTLRIFIEAVEEFGNHYPR